MMSKREDGRKRERAKEKASERERAKVRASEKVRARKQAKERAKEKARGEKKSDQLNATEGANAERVNEWANESASRPSLYYARRCKKASS